MDDLISRQAATDALERAKQNIRHNIERAIGRAICEILDEVENGIKQLPPIQPEITHEQAVEYLQSTGWMREHDLQMMLDGVHRLTVQPEIVRCKDCQYWNKGSCECPEHAVNCQDYYVGDIETKAEYFCGYAERRDVTT